MTALRRNARNKVLAEIRTFVASWFRDGKEEGLDADTPLVTSGIVDSAGVLEVVDFVEAKFGVKLGDADLNLRNCNSLTGWTDLVLGRLAESGRKAQQG
jgi:acyl carrier protein